MVCRPIFSFTVYKALFALIAVLTVGGVVSTVKKVVLLVSRVVLLVSKIVLSNTSLSKCWNHGRGGFGFN